MHVIRRSIASEWSVAGDRVIHDLMFTYNVEATSISSQLMQLGQDDRPFNRTEKLQKDTSSQNT